MCGIAPPSAITPPAELAAAIIEAGADRFSASIDGVTQATYGQYRINGDVKKAIAGLGHMVEQRLVLALPAVLELDRVVEGAIDEDGMLGLDARGFLEEGEHAVLVVDGAHRQPVEPPRSRPIRQSAAQTHLLESLAELGFPTGGPAPRSLPRAASWAISSRVR